MKSFTSSSFTSVHARLGATGTLPYGGASDSPSAAIRSGLVPPATAATAACPFSIFVFPEGENQKTLNLKLELETCSHLHRRTASYRPEAGDAGQPRRRGVAAATAGAGARGPTPHLPSAPMSGFDPHGANPLVCRPPPLPASLPSAASHPEQRRTTECWTLHAAAAN